MVISARSSVHWELITCVELWPLFVNESFLNPPYSSSLFSSGTPPIFVSRSTSVCAKLWLRGAFSVSSVSAGTTLCNCKSRKAFQRTADALVSGQHCARPALQAGRRVCGIALWAEEPLNMAV